MVSRGVTLVRVARHAIGEGGSTLLAVGLGSCIAVILHDAKRGAGGMAHVLLPDPAVAKDASNPFKFAVSAVPQLIDGLVRAGSDVRDLKARLVGGASMFKALLAPTTESMGDRNVAAARTALRLAGVPVNAEDVGGEYGRTVSFDVATGAVRVASICREDIHL